ncbi:MAG: hypothetical protein CMQ11_07045 [Gammaproteobacteria bacterium]|nr:hypothetical protein [Gammaproteobacteria bacterium]
MTIIVKMVDIRSAKLCSNGARGFFARHNLDWNKFLSEGLPEEVFIATGDDNALRVVEKARERHG